MSATDSTRRLLAAALLSGAALLLSGCEAPIVYQTPQDRQAVSAAVTSEKPGNYYVGYRFYKVDYKMWGWVKKPGEPWKLSLIHISEPTRPY